MHGRNDTNDRLYTSIRRLGRDLGVLILIDASGSTGEKSANGRSACEAQMHAAARIARTLELRGDRVAIYGFNSRGRANVYLYPIKLFEKPLDSRWRTNIARLSPAGFTRMGAAIRHASAILAKRLGTSRKVLVVLSDGFPYDDGYEAGYAMGDTRRALDEARRAESVPFACRWAHRAAIRTCRRYSAHPASAAPRVSRISGPI